MREVCLIVLFLAASNAENKMKVLHQWRSVDFEFPTPAARASAIQAKSFIPGNSIPLDVDVYQTGEYLPYKIGRASSTKMRQVGGLYWSVIRPFIKFSHSYIALLIDKKLLTLGM